MQARVQVMEVQDALHLCDMRVKVTCARSDMVSMRMMVFVEKGSVESTHKVPTSHYHTKHCHAAVVSLGGLTHRRGFSRSAPTPTVHAHPHCSRAHSNAPDMVGADVCGRLGGPRVASTRSKACPFAARPLAARAAADASGDVDEARLARLLRRLCTHQFHCPSLQIHQRPCQALAARL